MKVLGVDPGTGAAGYAVVETRAGLLRLVDAGCIVNRRKSDAAWRLGHIFKLLNSLIRRHRPEIVAVEKIFFNRNVKTAMAVAEAKGVILLTAHLAGLKVCEYTPLEIKLAVTGYGRANKSQVEYMVRRLVLAGQRKLRDDVSDAIAIAVTAIHHKKY